MIAVGVESPQQHEVIYLLEKSVAYIRSLYPEEQAHTYKMRELTRKRSRFFVVRYAGKAIGCGAYVAHGRRAIELKHMFIDDEFRGLGGGRKLLAAIEQVACEHGVKRIVLETSQKQVDAIGLYQAFGYTRCAPYTAHHGEDVFMHKLIG